MTLVKTKWAKLAAAAAVPASACSPCCSACTPCASASTAHPYSPAPQERAAYVKEFKQCTESNVDDIITLLPDDKPDEASAGEAVLSK